MIYFSIHADALPNEEMRGLLVFTLSAQALDREAAALAISENKADLVGGLKLARRSREAGDGLIDLAQRQTSNLSIMLTRDIVAQLAREVVLLDRP